LKFSAIEIYNEAVRDLLSMDNTPLRVLDDAEVNYYSQERRPLSCCRADPSVLQRGTVVEKITEVLLRDWNHLKELLAVCEGVKQHTA